jgi:hypothetical protein
LFSEAEYQKVVFSEKYDAQKIRGAQTDSKNKKVDLKNIQKKEDLDENKNLKRKRCDEKTDEQKKRKKKYHIWNCICSSYI